MNYFYDRAEIDAFYDEEFDPVEAFNSEIDYAASGRNRIGPLDAEYCENELQASIEARHKAANTCPSCGGWGDHGVEEDTGCLYVCYGCAGTGKYHCEAAA